LWTSHETDYIMKLILKNIFVSDEVCLAAAALCSGDTNSEVYFNFCQCIFNIHWYLIMTGGLNGIKMCVVCTL